MWEWGGGGGAEEKNVEGDGRRAEEPTKPNY